MLQASLINRMKPLTGQTGTTSTVSEYVHNVLNNTAENMKHDTNEYLIILQEKSDDIPCSHKMLFSKCR